jgi:hypothetical protein
MYEKARFKKGLVRIGNKWLRKKEYSLAAWVYERAGEEKKAVELREKIAKKQAANQPTTSI